MKLIQNIIRRERNLSRGSSLSETMPEGKVIHEARRKAPDELQAEVLLAIYGELLRLRAVNLSASRLFKFKMNPHLDELGALFFANRYIADVRGGIGSPITLKSDGKLITYHHSDGSESEEVVELMTAFTVPLIIPEERLDKACFPRAFKGAVLVGLDPGNSLPFFRELQSTDQGIDLLTELAGSIVRLSFSKGTIGSSLADRCGVIFARGDVDRNGQLGYVVERPVVSLEPGTELPDSVGGSTQVALPPESFLIDISREVQARQMASLRQAQGSA